MGEHVLVTVIFYSDKSLQLLHEVGTFEVSQSGRVILPNAFKEGKNIIAVYKGKVEVLNKIGDRILPVDYE